MSQISDILCFVLCMCINRVYICNNKLIIMASKIQNSPNVQDQNASIQTKNVTKEDLKREFSLKQLSLKEVQKQIDEDREQIKVLSSKVTSILNKKLKLAITVKDRHVFNPEYKNQKLKSLQQEKISVYKQCENLKKQIQELKTKDQGSFNMQIQQRNRISERLQKQIQNLEDSKRLLKEQLDRNKEQMDKFKNKSPINLQSVQRQLEQDKKQFKINDKHLQQVTNDQIMHTMYYYELKNLLQKKKETPTVKQHIDPNQIKQIIDEINKITEERKQSDRIHEQQQKRILKLIEEEQSIKEQKERSSRKQLHQTMKKVLQANRFKSDPKKPQKSISLKKNHYQEIFIKKNTLTARKNESQRVYMMHTDDEKCITIGEWLSDSVDNLKILTDQQKLNLQSIERIKMCTFFISNSQLVGVKCTYVDYGSNIIKGSSLIPPSMLSYSEIDIILDDLAYIQYETGVPYVYLKLCYPNESFKEIGVRNPLGKFSKINLEQFSIRQIQVMIESSQTEVLNIFKGMRIIITDKLIEQKINTSEIDQKLKSSSASDLHSKKKVTLRGKTLKKIYEEGPIDLRLQLGRNKMV